MADFAAAIRDLAKEFIASGDAPSPVAINTGLCADFASAFEETHGTSFPLASICSLDDVLDEEYRFDAFRVVQHRGFEPPPGLTYEDLNAIGAGEKLSHTWLEDKGMHHDAEVPEGVAHAFDLPCLRHGLHEILEAHDPAKLATLEKSNGWWAETARIRAVREPMIRAYAEGPRP